MVPIQSPLGWIVTGVLRSMDTRLDEINKGDFPGKAEGSCGAALRTMVFKTMPAALISRKRLQSRPLLARVYFCGEQLRFPQALQADRVAEAIMIRIRLIRNFSKEMMHLASEYFISHLLSQRTVKEAVVSVSFLLCLS